MKTISTSPSPKSQMLRCCLNVHKCDPQSTYLVSQCFICLYVEKFYKGLLKQKYESTIYIAKSSGSFAENKKADPLIEHQNIPDFSRTFPPRCVYVTKFHPESLSHKLFTSCFPVCNKIHRKSKDTISAFISFVIKK